MCWGAFNHKNPLALWPWNPHFFERPKTPFRITENAIIFFYFSIFSQLFTKITTTVDRSAKHTNTQTHFPWFEPKVPPCPLKEKLPTGHAHARKMRVEMAQCVYQPKSNLVLFWSPSAKQLHDAVIIIWWLPWQPYDALSTRIRLPW